MRQIKLVLRVLAAAALLGACVAAAEDLPPEFAGRQNPVAGDSAARDRGRTLFLDNCSPCHGEAADGHGPASVGLSPPPANLAGPDVVPSHSDAYLFYRISVGKRGTAMPSFAHSLSEDERWAVVVFLRSLGLQAGRPKEAYAAPPGG
jgi:mono/diheme cytochrome c family protein